MPGWSSETCILVTTKGASRIPADDLRDYLKKLVGASIHVTVRDMDRDLHTFVHIDNQHGRFYKYAQCSLRSYVLVLYYVLPTVVYVYMIGETWAKRKNCAMCNLIRLFYFINQNCTCGFIYFNFIFIPLGRNSNGFMSSLCPL